MRSLSLFIPVVVLLSQCAVHAQTSSDEGLPWSAYWVWGTENMQQGNGFFRLSFDVGNDVSSAVLQGSGDDGYTLYLNGEEIRRGGFGFHRTDRTDLTGRLIAGRNILAAVCTNAAYPGGWLAELSISYKDGREQLVVSDRDTLFHHEEQPGWQTLGFDDNNWEKCKEIARPPGGVWGELPLEYAGQRDLLELVAFTTPETVKAGQSVTVRGIARPAATMRHPAVVKVMIVRGTASLGEATWSPSPPAKAWKPGANITLGPIDVPTNLYASSGPAEIRLTIEKCTLKDIGTSASRDLTIEGREGTVGATPAKVAMHQGAPALFVDGKPMPAMLYLQGRKPIPAEYAQMADAGYKVFSLGLGMGWRGPGDYDYTGVDENILAALEGAPDGYLIPRVDITAPAWWLDLHPEEINGLGDWSEHSNDVYGGTRHQSFASALWRAEAGEALRRLVEHIQKSPFADRVIGYHIATGIYGEWHLWSPSHLPDVSNPMRKAFVEWCRERYDDDLTELNAAWHIKLASIEEIECPMQAPRYEADLGAFKDASKSRYVSDYWQCLHETTVDAINHFCKVVKDQTDEQALTGVFYAYLTDIGWPQEGGHLAAHKAFESPYIDFFSSPHSYSHRAMGQDGAFRAYPASIQLHGKLFIDEGDDRTHLTGDTPYTHAKTLEQDVAIMRREILNVLTNRVGMWWFDMTSGWFNDPALLRTAADLRVLGQRTLLRPRESYSEIAVVFDPTTYYTMADWKTEKDPLCTVLCNEQFQQLQRIGAPYDVLLLDDIFHPNAKDYRCYIFLNTWRIPMLQRERIVRQLQGGGRALVFAYAPGFADQNGLAVGNISDLTGMRFDMSEAGGSLQASWSPAAGTVPGLATGASFGPEKFMAPRFSPSVDENSVLARWADNAQPAVALVDQGDWLSLYSGTGPIPAALIAHVARRAGAHIWTDAYETGSNFYAGNGLFGVHTEAEGPNSFALPWPAKVKDALSGEVLLEQGKALTIDLPQYATGIYEIERLR